MKRINSLSDLLMEELADLLNAESQLAGALPKITEACHLPELRGTFEDYLGITNEHVIRLQDIFSNIGQNPQRLICKAMQGLIREWEYIASKNEKNPISDAVIVNVAQRVEEYKIARYKSVREHAADLGHTKIVELFTKTLNEERAMNFHFNELAQGMINAQAIDPASPQTKEGGFYIPEGRFNRGGIKTKPKNTDVSRFISEGNPNLQEPEVKGEEGEK